MAGKKLLGTLGLDLGDIEAKVTKANQALQKLGKGIDLDLTQIASDKIDKSLKQLMKAAEDYGKKMGDLGRKAKTSTSDLTSSIVSPTSIKMLEQANGQIRMIQEGLDRAGNKVRETSVNGRGIISKTTVDDIKRAADEQKRLNEALAKSQRLDVNQQNTANIRELVSLYKQLGDAESKRLSAQSNDDVDRWRQRADAIRQSIQQLLTENPALKENAQVMAAKQKADDQAAAALEKYRMASERAYDAQDKLNAKQQEANSPVKQSEQLYKDLSKAIQDYNKAMKAGNAEGADVFKSNIENMRGKLEELKSTLASMSPNDPGFSQLATNIARAETAMAGFGREAQSAADSSNKIGESIMTWMSRMIMYRGLRQMWSEAKNFATDYYATLNEIQVVTMKSDSQVQAMAKNFTGMSQSLRVPLTDIASAATIFYRQGLNDEQVNTRLEALTKFSKISGTNIEDAAQYFTAVLNSFDELEGNAQRVSDVFTYIGKQHCRLVA